MSGAPASPTRALRAESVARWDLERDVDGMLRFVDELAALCS